MNAITYCITRWLVVGFCLALSATAAAEEDSIVLDPDTGNYIITYRFLPTAPLEQVVWIPSTKIDPVVKSGVKARTSHPYAITYRYKFKNGRTSRQDLDGGRIWISSAIADSQVAPPGWRGLVVPARSRSSGFLSSWSYNLDESEINGIRPGGVQTGFGFDSADLPGIGVVELRGFAPPGQSFPDEGPSEDSPIYQQLVSLQVNNFVSRNAAVPKIPVPTPFDGSAVLDSLRAHISKDIVDLKLIDPILASELDRTLQAAADAIRRNSTKAARDHLHDAFKLVHKAHPDVDKDDDDDDEDEAKKKGKSGTVHPIDRLAARVIAFDIKYVEKRLKKD